MDFFVISVCCTVIIGILVLINGYLVYYTLQKEFEDLHPELFIKAVEKISTKHPRSELPTRRGSKTLTPVADVTSTAAPSGRTSFTTLTEGARGTSARTSFTSLATGTRPSSHGSRSSRTPPTTAGELSTRTSGTALTSVRRSHTTLPGDMSTAAGSATSLATTAVTNASAPPESENVGHTN